MSEENTNEIVPAMLSEGEAVIPADNLEEVAEAIEEEVTTEAEPEEEPVALVAEEPVVVEAPAEPTVILAEEPAEEIPALTPVADGVIGTGTVKRKAPSKKAEPEVVEDAAETLAVYSSKNLHWPGVGSLLRGYSILPAAVADRWVSRNRNVRLATPEEIAQEFGK